MTIAQPPVAPTAIDLSRLGMLTRLVINQPGFAVSSKTLKEEAVEKHQADRKSIRSLVLIFTEEQRQYITKAITEGRRILTSNTLPWEEPYRLCPLKRFAQLRVELTQQENAYLDAVDDLCADYDALREDYRLRVNSVLASEIPFPSLQQIKQGFRWELRTSTLPEPKDFKPSILAPQLVEEIRASMATQYEEKLAVANGDIVKQLAELVGRMKEQTSNPKGKIFDSLVGNIQEAVERLPGLNIADDPKIEKLINTVKRELTMVDPQQLREDERYREATSKTANSVLNELKNFGL